MACPTIVTEVSDRLRTCGCFLAAILKPTRGYLDALWRHLSHQDPLAPPSPGSWVFRLLQRTSYLSHGFHLCEEAHPFIPRSCLEFQLRKSYVVILRGWKANPGQAYERTGKMLRDIFISRAICFVAINSAFQIILWILRWSNFISYVTGL